jgi:hypothetical protein
MDERRPRVINLDAEIERIAQYGPTRVVVREDGYAVPPRRAREEYGITPDVIYLRDDGWSLGATITWADVAWGKWPDRWIGAIHLEDGRVLGYVTFI